MVRKPNVGDIIYCCWEMDSYKSHNEFYECRVTRVGKKYFYTEAIPPLPSLAFIIDSYSFGGWTSTENNKLNSKGMRIDAHISKEIYDKAKKKEDQISKILDTSFDSLSWKLVDEISRLIDGWYESEDDDRFEMEEWEILSD